MLGGIYLNYYETDAKSISRTKVQSMVAEGFRGLDFVEDAYPASEMRSKKDRPYLQIFRNGFSQNQSPDVMLRLKKHYLIHAESGTSHGSPYDYDTHVPIVFLGSQFQHQIHDRKVEVVDIAPTMAALLELKADKKVDGSVLNEVVR